MRGNFGMKKRELSKKRYCSKACGWIAGRRMFMVSGLEQSLAKVEKKNQPFLLPQLWL